MEREPQTILNLQLPLSLKKQLKREAAAAGVSVSQLVRLMVGNIRIDLVMRDRGPLTGKRKRTKAGGV